MEFRVIIDREQEESLVATVHTRTPLIDEIEKLILQQNTADTIPGYTDEGICLLSVARIECITVLEGKTYAIAADGQRYRLKQRLYELEETLPSRFIRINKSALANQDRLERFAVTYAGSVDAVFQCGYREYVSRRCFAQIKRRLEGK